MSKSTPINIAIVGHTNTGKTSLMRTLCHDPNFGQVKNSPSTTKYVEGVLLNAGPDHESRIALYDTPGLEDGIGLLDYLEQINTLSIRTNGVKAIENFLQSPESNQRFEQEARVLRQILKSDACLYVIDVRDPVLGKHKDELAILNCCAKPVIAILNFLHHPNNHLAEWEQTLANLGLHINLQFDTVAPTLDSEEMLYRKLGLILPKEQPYLNQLALNIHQQKNTRHNLACELVAELLIDIGAYKIEVPNQEPELSQATIQLQNQIREQEYKYIQKLLKLYKFNAQEYPDQFLPLVGERWKQDLFHPQTMVDMGIDMGKGFAKGAVAGVTVDIFMAGTTLGSAALIGGVLGTLWQSGRDIGQKVIDTISNKKFLSASDEVLRLLAIRQLQLVQTLDLRGHADTLQLKVNPHVINQIKQEKLPNQLEQVRAKPHWSKLSDSFTPSPERNAAIKALGVELR